MKGAISMKKKVILAIAVASLMMSACSTSQSATVDKTEDNNKQTSLTQKTVNEETLAVDTDSSIQREFAYELTSMGDYNRLAMDFNELVNDADMIIKIKVESVTPYINENGMIQSEIVPVVEEVYKGKYNGEKLYVNGGEMLYDDFIQNDIIREQLSGHEDPDADKESMSGKYVKQTVDNQYIFHKGDEYVFFALEDELDRESLCKLDSTAWEKGISRVKPHANHRNTDISLIVLAIVSVVLGVKPTVYLIQAPIALILIFGLAYGFGMILATIGVFFRDMEYLWSVGLMLVMYTCAIFYYPPKLLKSGWAWILKYNPCPSTL